MRFEAADGGEVQAGRHTTEADAIAHAIGSATDDEIRGFLARILKAAGIGGYRAARILHTTLQSTTKWSGCRPYSTPGIVVLISADYNTVERRMVLLGNRINLRTSVG